LPGITGDLSEDVGFVADSGISPKSFSKTQQLSYREPDYCDSLMLKRW